MVTKLMFYVDENKNIIKMCMRERKREDKIKVAPQTRMEHFLEKRLTPIASALDPGTKSPNPIVDKVIKLK